MRKEAVLIFLAVVLLTCGCTGQPTPTAGGDVKYTGTLPTAAPVQYIDTAGNTLTITGFPGYVYLFADRTTEMAAVQKAVEANGGTIVDSFAKAGIYTVKVGAGQEETFLTAMSKESWFEDGSPAFAFVPADIIHYDYYSGASNPTDCGDDHGDLTALKAGRFGTSVDTNEMKVIDGMPADGLARSIVAKAEDYEQRGMPAVFSFSLQSETSGGIDIHDFERSAGCISVNCTAVKNAQRAFLRDFYKTMDEIIADNPAAADNMIMVIAAGNAGAPIADQIKSLENRFPAAAKHIKIVGSSNADGTVANDMNFGGDMSYARGSDAKIINPDTGTVTSCDGTSFATPEVAAVLDDIWYRNPTLTATQVMDAFTQALNALHTGGVLPQDANGETPESFIAKASAIGENIANGGNGGNGGGNTTINGGGGTTSHITFTGPGTLNARVGQDFSRQLCAPESAAAGATCGGLTPATNPSGGNPPYSMSVKIGGGFLPPGISLGLSGFLSGTPTTAGNYPFQVCARDGAGLEGCANVEIDVEAAAPPAPTVATYSGSFSGGATYDKYDGCSFSDGFSGTISMDTEQAADGSISGTATVSGTFTSTAMSNPDMCLNSQVPMDGTATISGTTSNMAFTEHFYTAGGSDYAGAFTGSLSGNTITGTLGETSSCCSGSASMPVTLNKE